MGFFSLLDWLFWIGFACVFVLGEGSIGGFAVVFWVGFFVSF